MKVFLAIAIVIGYFVLRHILDSAVHTLADRKNVDSYRTKYIARTIQILLLIFSISLLLSFWGVEYSQVAIFLSSIFAIIGVALFAQWSILSNITGSLIIFFGFPYRVGDKVKVVDKDEDITGVIEEIALFHVQIRRGNDLISYPNSVMLQKPVIKLADNEPNVEMKNAGIKPAE